MQGSRKGSLWPLCTFALAALLPFATALECSIDLSVFGADEGNPGVVAQCDAGCDSCNFSLADGNVFGYGIVECLANVPCFVRVDWGYLNYTTVNGSQASVLTLDSANAVSPWLNAVIYAPANRGNLRFEASDSIFAANEVTTTEPPLCFVDLSDAPSYYYDINPVPARCEEGCESCNFSLPSKCFQDATIECLPNVDCRLSVSSPMSCLGGALVRTTINGSLASALTVEVTGSVGDFSLQHVKIYAPANTGDFHFESNTKGALLGTNIYAVDSGVVNFVINDDGVDDENLPELFSMNVNASKSEELKITLGEGTRYAKYDDSLIVCPEVGSCLWQSSGQRYFSINPDWNALVNLTKYASTNLRVICAHSAKSCEGLYVHCDDTSDSCQLQYAANEWTCVGNGNCNAAVSTMPYTTTPNPVPTTETPTSTTETPAGTTQLPVPTTTLQYSGGGGANDWKLWQLIVVSIGSVALLGLCAFAGYKMVSERSEEASEKWEECSLDANGSIRLKATELQARECKESNLTFDGKAKESRLAKFCAKNEEQVAIEKLVMDETQGAGDGELQPEGVRGHGCEVSAEPLTSILTVGGTATAQTPGVTLPRTRCRSHSESLIEDQPEGVPTAEGVTHATGTGQTTRGQGAFGDDTGFVGDAVADEDLEDEMMYFAGSDWPTTK